jgi:FAD/FMN-containing dehydrogenase
VGRWRGCPPRPPRSPTGPVGSWCTWPRSTSVPRTRRSTGPGSTAWPRRCTRATGRRALYVNFIGDEGEARVHDAYPGPTWERLAAIKARYDPSNLFHRNQNIPPTKGHSDGGVSAAGNRDLRAG